MSNKKVSKSRRKYDVTFKEDVIKMVASGRPVVEVSQALGVSASLIHRWCKSVQEAYVLPGRGKGSFPAVPNPLFNENERLKADLRRTEQERDILKKALSIFSRGN